jgi:hypothetical protein
MTDCHLKPHPIHPHWKILRLAIGAISDECALRA